MNDRRLCSLESLVMAIKRKNFVYDSVIYSWLMKRFKNMKEIIKFRSFCDSMSSRIKDESTLE